MAEWLRLLTNKSGDLGSIPAEILFQRYSIKLNFLLIISFKKIHFILLFYPCLFFRRDAHVLKDSPGVSNSGMTLIPRKRAYSMIS